MTKLLPTVFPYGLKDDVKNLLITMPKVETLQEFITQAITCDNRLFERRQEKRFGRENANHTIISTSSNTEKNASGPEPMQIDEARYKPLSQGGKNQGCHNRRFWMKMSVRTSFSYGRPPASALTRGRGKNRVRANAAMPPCGPGSPPAWCGCVRAGP
jgi:hypothetical protein